LRGKGEGTEFKDKLVVEEGGRKQLLLFTTSMKI